MANVEVKLNNGSCCCCCYGETDLINMLEPQYNNGNIEICASMITDCYGIDMYLDFEDKFKNLLMICNLCMSRLRNALQFKNEVQNAYNRMRDYFYGYSLSKIKTEYSDGDPLEHDNSLTLNVKVELHSEPEDNDDSHSFIQIEVENSENKEEQSTVSNIQTEESRRLKYHSVRKEKSSTSNIEKANNGEFTRKSSQLQANSDQTLRYKCPKCPERFLNFLQRANHLVNIHNDETQIRQCQYCNKGFKIQAKLRRHVDSVHLKIRNFACQVCNVMFCRKEDLKNHMFCHTQKKDFHCDVCPKSFSRKNALTEHMRTHNEIKNFLCDACNKAFTQKWSLVRHIKTHFQIKNRKRNRRKAVSVKEEILE